MPLSKSANTKHVLIIIIIIIIITFINKRGWDQEAIIINFTGNFLADFIQQPFTH